MRKHTGIVVGAGLGVVGCLMTWGTVSAGIFSKSVSGMETGDGPVFLTIFIIVGVISLMAWLSDGESSLLAVLAILAGLGLIVGGVMDMVGLAEKANLAKNDDIKLSIEIGAGLYMVIGGAVMMLLGGITDLVGESKKPTTTTPPQPATAPPLTQPAGPPASIPCPSCGGDTMASAKFCAHCAAALPSQDLTLDCPACHKSVAIGSTFCPHCAAKMPGFRM
ncbi:zinc ribbon domain-containing protein [Myxococcota bacterium]|nr:zinc ribbon domain-containing protein [Myxococcota bacterium]MBU1536485.1 zinc ribbon domain-containing protein [Myxococcota bacterium]